MVFVAIFYYLKRIKVIQVSTKLKAANKHGLNVAFNKASDIVSVKKESNENQISESSQKPIAPNPIASSSLNNSDSGIDAEGSVSSIWNQLLSSQIDLIKTLIHSKFNFNFYARFVPFC